MNESNKFFSELVIFPHSMNESAANIIKMDVIAFISIESEDINILNEPLWVCIEGLLELYYPYAQIISLFESVSTTLSSSELGSVLTKFLLNVASAV